jgi:hypothetical protein
MTKTKEVDLANEEDWKLADFWQIPMQTAQELFMGVKQVDSDLVVLKSTDFQIAMVCVNLCIDTARKTREQWKPGVKNERTEITVHW